MVSATPSCLDGLPFDVTINILGKLDVEDILAVRATCRSLDLISREQDVWTQVLNRHCERHGVLRSTYPVKQMSTSQLEHASRLPSRFERLMSSVDSAPTRNRLVSAATRILDVAGADDEEGDIQCMQLIPGGRFLVTGSDVGDVKIWDLGYNPSCTIGRKPLNVIPMTGAVHTMLVQAHTGNSFILVVESEPEDPELVFYDWDVFEVSIQGDQHPTCSSTTRATLYGLESGAEATLEGRYLAIEGDGRVLLWDWVDNLWGTIPRYLRRLESTPSLGSQWGAATPQIIPPYIALYNVKLAVLLIYKIPTLQARSPDAPDDSRPDLDVAPHMVIPIAHFTMNLAAIRRWLPLDTTWLSSISVPAYSVVISTGSIRPSDNTALWISLQLRGETASEPGLAVAVRTSDVGLGPEECWENSWVTMETAEGRVYNVWNADQGVTAYVSATGRDGSGASGERSHLASDPLTRDQDASAIGRRPMVLTKPLGIAGHSLVVHFCPLSGRVCTFTGNGEIRVIDYCASSPM